MKGNGLKVEIITIGNEVLRSETRENNGEYLSRILTGSGIEPVRITVLPDDQDLITEEMGKAAGRCDAVIVTGGLGPTVDDLTRQAAIALFGGQTELKDEITESIEKRFRELGLQTPESYRDLARIPAGARVLPNSVGAAPGLALKYGRSEIYLLPGVPAEMHSIFQSFVLPELSGGDGEKKTVIQIFGLMETSVEERLSRLFDERLKAQISITADPAGIKLYLPARLVKDDTIDSLRKLFGSHIFSIASEKMEDVVIDLLKNSGSTLSVAESFTGGLLASTLISVPGASESFLEGFVTYSNESKEERLGVDHRLIGRCGAVSEEVCVSMAQGALKAAGSDIALSTTGIAGPGGATAGKSVGLCYIGMAAQDSVYCRRMQFPGDRYTVRLRGVYVGLDMLRLRLSGEKERLSKYIVTDR
ncbi:MAG: CinA family nicotinamide mononucleotide deamidase-related protein [Candidatus Krumholzibacteriota bacterium]|nr:CinA family nicotinamide mononucleotide deamidase-related protein [Candidatus Krumholzibacteriota bacterium]